MWASSTLEDDDEAFHVQFLNMLKQLKTLDDDDKAFYIQFLDMLKQLIIYIYI